MILNKEDKYNQYVSKVEEEIIQYNHQVKTIQKYLMVVESGTCLTDLPGTWFDRNNPLEQFSESKVIYYFYKTC